MAEVLCGHGPLHDLTSLLTPTCRATTRQDPRGTLVVVVFLLGVGLIDTDPLKGNSYCHLPDGGCACSGSLGWSSASGWLIPTDQMCSMHFPSGTS
jgi:hypothetical protein